MKRLSRSSVAIAVAGLLLLLALFMPKVKVSRDVYDYLVVFDISQSMYVEDYEIGGMPASRLAVARESARRAIRDLPCGSRVGWAAFTGYRTLMLLAPVEVCAQYNDLLTSLDRIDGRMRWSEASEIGKGIYWSIRAAQDTKDTPSVIFMTDGQEAPPIDQGAPTQLSQLEQNTIRGWLIGLGGFVPSPIPKFDADGKRLGYWRSYEVIQIAAGAKGSAEHLSSLREPYLQALAKGIGFDYARASDETTLGTVLRDERFARKRAVETDLYRVPTGLAILVLIVGFWPELKLRPRRRRYGTGDGIPG